MNNNENQNSHNDHNMKGMIWMMIPCILLLGFVFLGGSKLFSGGYLWPVLIGVFVVAHIWMMFKGHGGHGSRKDDGAETKDVEGKHKGGGCCH